jgi:plasmid stability protein
MSTLAVENLNETFLAGLRTRAAVHGWTLQQEVKSILEAAAVPRPDAMLDSVDLLERSMEPAWPSPDQEWVLAFLPES